VDLTLTPDGPEGRFEVLPEEQSVAVRRVAADRQLPGHHPQPAGCTPASRPSGGVNYWTAEEPALLGADHDEVIAAKVGRTATAVEWKRGVLKIPPFVDRRTG
jgi:hypothetical protein